MSDMDLLTGGPVGRRELVGTLARWTVPTVVTLTLGARVLAAASCPPCTKRTGGTCKACSTSQILNCQCEPCLGPPYCAAVPAPPAFGSAKGGAPGGASSPSSAGVPGGASSPQGNGYSGQLGGGGGSDSRVGGGGSGNSGLKGPTTGNPISPYYDSPFMAQPRYQPLGGNSYDSGGLYGRLRGDTISSRRRP